LFLGSDSGSTGEKYGMQIGCWHNYSHVGIFGIADSGSNNSTGDLTFDFRAVATDTALTERVRISHEGDVTLSSGNLVIATADKGISFTGGTDPDTAGSATANILDDYEEGTWTPAWSFDGGGSVSGSQTAHYTRVGRLVTCTFDIIVNSTSGSPVGSATLTGFPFTNDNVSSRGMVGVSYSTGFGTIPVTGYINQNAANAAILVSHGDSYLNATAYGGNERMMGSFLYFVA